MKFYHWLGSANPYTREVPQIPNQKMRLAGMDVIRKRSVNAFVQDEIYDAMISNVL